MRKQFRLISVSILLVFVVAGCVNYARIASITDVPEDSLQEIPVGAKTIMVAKDNVTADSLYNEAHRIVTGRGHTLVGEDKESYIISTKGMDLGLNTIQRMRLVVTDNLGVARLSITTEWKHGMDPGGVDQAMSRIPIDVDWEIAKWEISNVGIAFAESVAVAQRIKNGKISYKQ